MNFESLVNQHKDAVYRQMIRVCGNREDAEDVLIDALFKAYRNLGQLREAAAFRAWLAKIANRVCWQLRKRDALLPILQLSTLEQEGRELASEDAPVDSQVELAQMKALLRGAIATLPEPYRQVYELRDLQNLDGPEVAKKLQLSTAAMKSRLHRARALVREQLDAALQREQHESVI
ncbi:MAG: sigma-70 family RNA polymerase sigma factor [Acidobacteria bacterium]|nr:sigma-70 family RNA polymerase sigma factor [Acidobacteriota bacterium]